MKDQEALVLLRQYIPGILVELRYATEQNFTGKVIYDFDEAYLRKGTAEKLAVVQQGLQKQGLGLKVWDALRPVEAQFVLWKAVPDARFVADPYHGYSNHSRGNAIDLTLVDAEGQELEMPTDFDDFTPQASRSYLGISAQARKNALLLQNLMEAQGFLPNPHEWWHFDDVERYEVYQGQMPSGEAEGAGSNENLKGEFFMDHIFENIRTRRSIRAFTKQEIARADLEKIVQAGAWAPTAMNRQTFQFTVIPNRVEIERLADILGAEMGEAAYDFYKPAALILVSNQREGTNPVADTACAMENMFLQAHALGIASVWINQFKDLCDRPAVRAVLKTYGIPQDQIVWAACALGYSAQKEVAAPERRAVIRFID